MEKATFAAGCFWGVEECFRTLPGVISTQVGYCGGTTKNPSYEDVCSDTTGHAEAVEVEFDPATINYEKLLEAFWASHDPTTVNRQGLDVGSQYRSGIFCHTKQQLDAALKAKKMLETSGRFSRPISTQIVENTNAPFYRAEEYHQQYFNKRGMASCHMPKK